MRRCSTVAVAIAAAAMMTGCSTGTEQVAEPPRPVARAEMAPPEPVPANFALRGALTQGGMAIGTAPPDTVAVTIDGRPVGLASGGRFMVGFPRDAAPAATIIARTGDGRLFRQQLAITQRSWQIESIPSLPQSTKPDPEYEKLRQSETSGGESK